MKYCRIFIFFLIVNPAIIITQYNVVLEKPINYNYISWIKGSKPELLCPTNGYVDQLSLQPVFQLKLSQGKYKTIDFEFEERELTKNEMLTYKNLIFDSTYSKTFRKQEQNNKTWK